MEDKPIIPENKEDSPKNNISSNFDFLYDSFHQPLTDILTLQGAMIGINLKGEIKHFNHTKETEVIEEELSKYCKEQKLNLLDLKLSHYYNSLGENLNDSLKYIMCFYKVHFKLTIGNIRIFKWKL